MNRPCPDLAELELFVSSELPDDSSASIEKHVRSCGDCRALMADVVENLRVVAPIRDAIGRTDSSRSGPTMPATIGPYEVVREVGRGGMGVVYEAQQQNPRRRVALKVLHAAAALSERHDRLFRRETQALARLRHPDIAAIYEAGATADGRSFIVMELVEGAVLRDFARDAGATRSELLHLFKRICEAIAYAHQRGVIHRDLKPSNILVSGGTEGLRDKGTKGTAIAIASSLHPSVPSRLAAQPKILDFGLAKMLEADDSEAAVATALTEPGRIEGTLPYMSPEQVRGDLRDIDVRSDVYSLGVILYELLVGRLPYPIDRARLAEAARTICEQAPRRPSEIDRSLRGDIETILLKALEKEPDRRYSSAAALAEDIGRCLNQQPILARPPTLSYQLRKLLVRHKLAFASVAALFALLVAFSAAMSMMYAQANTLRVAAESNLTRAAAAESDAKAQAARARQEAATATRVKDFLVKVFEVSDPDRGEARDALARDVLHRGAERVAAELDDQPLVQAALTDTIGRVYEKLTLYDESAALLERSAGIWRAQPDDRRAELAASLEGLAQAYRGKDDLAAAERVHREALAIRREVYSGSNVLIASSLHNLAGVLYLRGDHAQAERCLNEALEIVRATNGGDSDTNEGSVLDLLANVYNATARYAEAEELSRRVLMLRREQFGDDHLKVATTLQNLAVLRYSRGDYTEADALLSEALAIYRRRVDPLNEHLAKCLSNLAEVKKISGDLDGAEPLLREALDIRRQRLGPTHSSVALSYENLGGLLEARGQLEAAEKALSDSVEIRRRVQGEHADTARTINNLGYVLQRQKRYDEAESLYAESLEMRRRVLPTNHPDISHALLTQGRLRLERDDPAGAEAPLREALEIRRNSLKDAHPMTASSMVLYGECLARLGRFDEAEPLMLDGFQRLQRSMGAANARTRDALKRVISLYTLWGKDDRAAEYQAALDQASPDAAPTGKSQ